MNFNFFILFIFLKHTTTKTLLKITDILGRKTNQIRNTLLLYIYDYGIVEKKIIIEQTKIHSIE